MTCARESPLAKPFSLTNTMTTIETTQAELRAKRAAATERAAADVAAIVREENALNELLTPLNRLRGRCGILSEQIRVGGIALARKEKDAAELEKKIWDAFAEEANLNFAHGDSLHLVWSAHRHLEDSAKAIPFLKKWIAGKEAELSATKAELIAYAKQHGLDLPADLK